MISQQLMQTYRKKVNELLAEYHYITSTLNKTIESKKALEEYLNDAIEARAIIQNIARQTQEQLEEEFSNLVTLLLQSVFEDDRRFGIEFIERRNNTEVECYIVKNGIKSDLFEGGGGQIDIVSLGCSIAFWKLEGCKRPIFILDEKVKFVHSPQLLKNLSNVLKLISEKLGLQFIFVSDQEDLTGGKEFGVINGEVYDVQKTILPCPRCEATQKESFLYFYTKQNKEIQRCKACGYIKEK